MFKDNPNHRKALRCSERDFNCGDETSVSRPSVDLLSTMLNVNGPNLNDWQTIILRDLMLAETVDDWHSVLGMIEATINDTDWGDFEQVTSIGQVNQPSHYSLYPMEPIWFMVTGGYDFFQYNAGKYIFRYPFKKDGKQDLEKAARYVKMAIARLEGSAEWFR